MGSSGSPVRAPASIPLHTANTRGDVLAFVARRIEAEPIAFVVALAEEDALRFMVPDPQRVLLSPLADRARVQPL